MEIGDSMRNQHNTSLAYRATFAYQERNYARLFKLLKRMDVVPRLAFYWVWPRVIRDIDVSLRLFYISVICILL